MLEFLKLSNWQTNVCGGLMLLCMAYGLINENATGLCELLGIGIGGIGHILGVDKTRMERIRAVVDKYVLLYKEHPIDEVFASTAPPAVPPPSAPEAPKG